MTYNPAIIPGSLIDQEPAVVAEALRSLISDDLRLEARQVYSRYRQVQPEKSDLALLYADILLNADQLDEAERLLEEEFQKNPDRFSILFRMGRLEEIRGQNINAFDLYRQAEHLAENPIQNKEARLALEQVKNNISSEILFHPDSFTIKLRGNLNPLNLQYWVKQLTGRKELLEAILSNLDPGAESALEIECDTGVVTRNLAAHGLKVEGTAAEMTDLILAMGFEFVEMLRKTGGMHPEGYHCFPLDQNRAREMEKRDVILLLPARLQWYRERGGEAAAALLAELCRKARRQFFFYFPVSEREGEHRETARVVLAGLARAGRLGRDRGPELCFTGKDGGLLYRVDRKNVDKEGLLGRLPRGLEVLDSRSSVFEVDVVKCRSLNGFGFNGSDWNHFTALLEEMLHNPQLKYEESVLKRFYDRFRPRNRQEQLFGPETGALPPLDRGFALLPWVETRNRSLNPVESPQSREGGNHQYGPNSDDFGRQQVQRLLDNYRLVYRYGYRPEIFPDGFVQGYLLRDGDDYRFYVNEGQHRMAAIGLLGHKTIRVRFNPDFMPVVDLKDIRHWPQVRSGFYSTAVAEKVFRYYFGQNGRRKAQKMGLA